MDKEKIDNCFIDEQANYEYDITIDGEYLATAKSLSAIDSGYIQQHSFTIARNEDGSICLDKKGNPLYDIHLYQWQLHTIERALVKWRWKREITLENIALLPEKILNHIFFAIRQHEESYTKNKEAIEKN